MYLLNNPCAKSHPIHYQHQSHYFSMNHVVCRIVVAVFLPTYSINYRLAAADITVLRALADNFKLAAALHSEQFVKPYELLNGMVCTFAMLVIYTCIAYTL